MRIKQAVILAGGTGTRLKPLTDNMPKPMIPMNNKPFLEYLLAMLRDNGIEEVLLLLGYMPEKIMDYFGDGSRFGVRMKYAVSDVDFDTGKRLKLAAELVEDHFLLMYCDNYHPLNLKKRVEHHVQKGALVTVAVYSNKDNFSKNNIRVDSEGYVTLYDRARLDPTLSGVEIGFFIVDKRVYEFMPDDNFSFESVILPLLIERRELAAYLTDHRYYSIGSLERLPATERFLKPRRVVFLDRDGVINKKAMKAEYIRKWEEFAFLPGAMEALKTLSAHDYEIYIITNQAGIARGMMSLDDLQRIHEKMQEELERNGVVIGGIYCCPHGWDEGCECRKPKPGMFYQAAREHFIDLTKSVFIGDDERDIETGNNAGTPTILVNNREAYGHRDISLGDAVDKIIEHGERYSVLLYSLLYKISKSKNERAVVSIGGCSRSGKTVLAEMLERNLEQRGVAVRILKLDNWLKGVDERTGKETVRERYDYTAIAGAVNDLREGKQVRSPSYDARTRKTVKQADAPPISMDTGVIIVDGTISLDIPELRESSDFKVFVEIDDILRKRRLVSFYREYKKCSEEETNRIIAEREKEEIPIIKDTREFADFILRFEG